MPANDEYDVEIISVAPGNSAPAPLIEPLRKNDAEHRSLLELHRRDLIMLGIGGGVVGGALLIGWGVSRLLRSPSPASPAQDEKQPESNSLPKKQLVKPSEEKKEEPTTDEPKTKDMKKEESKTETKTAQPKK